MPEAFNIAQYLGIASVYLFHHELKSWYEMSSTFSSWVKAAIMAAASIDNSNSLNVHQCRFENLLICSNLCENNSLKISHC